MSLLSKSAYILLIMLMWLVDPPHGFVLIKIKLGLHILYSSCTLVTVMTSVFKCYASLDWDNQFNICRACCAYLCSDKRGVFFLTIRSLCLQVDVENVRIHAQLILATLAHQLRRSVPTLFIWWSQLNEITQVWPRDIR